MAFFIAVFSASFFTWALPLVEAFRVEHPEAMFAMPLLVLLVWWDRTRLHDVISTRAKVAFLQRSVNGVVEEAPRPLSVSAGFKQIVFTLLAHAVGASVGREAVGLQLGAWGARLRGARGWYFGACMAAGFAIVLGTPAAAAVFIFESKRWKLTWLEWAGVPLLAWLAYRLSLVLGVSHTELYPFSKTAAELRSLGIFNFGTFTVLLVVVSTFVSYLFLRWLHFVARRATVEFKNPVYSFVLLTFVMIAFYFAGFARVDSLGLAGLGTRGLYSMWVLDPMNVKLWEHPLVLAILKTGLTASFVGIGVRGGELTPLLVIGGFIATGIAVALNFPIAGVVSLGVPLVWGITARRPVAAAVLAIELFGLAPWGLLGAFVLLTTWLGIKAGDFIGLYASFGKMKPEPDHAEWWRRGLYD